MKKYNINLVFFNKSSSPYAIMVVERFNRTIREKIRKYQNAYKTKRYIDELDDIVSNYNSSKHSMINMTPLEAENKKYIDNDKKIEKFHVQNHID